MEMMTSSLFSVELLKRQWKSLSWLVNRPLDRVLHSAGESYSCRNRSVVFACDLGHWHMKPIKRPSMAQYYQKRDSEVQIQSTPLLFVKPYTNSTREVRRGDVV